MLRISWSVFVQPRVLGDVAKSRAPNIALHHAQRSETIKASEACILRLTSDSFKQAYRCEGRRPS